MAKVRRPGPTDPVRPIPFAAGVVLVLLATVGPVAAQGDPYRWVSPPPDTGGANLEPTDVSNTLRFIEEGSQPTSVSTSDGQAVAIFELGAVQEREGEDRVEVTIEPMDPSPFPAPEESLRLDGNAYRIEATYAESGEAVEPTEPVRVGLRYPRDADVLLRLDDDAWVELETEVASASPQVFAPTDTLGTFAAAGVPEDDDFPDWIPIVSLATTGLLAALVVWAAGRRRHRST